MTKRMTRWLRLASALGAVFLGLAAWPAQSVPMCDGFEVDVEAGYRQVYSCGDFPCEIGPTCNDSFNAGQCVYTGNPNTTCWYAEQSWPYRVYFPCEWRWGGCACKDDGTIRYATHTGYYTVTDCPTE
ncbi:MAG: hypothetical protein IT204_24340 [Fimbriimonadaceae bacterium]|nr:hypothetical protein [Fimbriimonadaceae bacterium]